MVLKQDDIVVARPLATPLDADADDSKDVFIGGDDDKTETIDQERERLRSLFSYDDSKRLLRRADLHILPILIAIYLCKNMDDNLVGFLPPMNAGSPTNILVELNITPDQYAYARTVFSVTYLLFEVPSNFMIKWATPRLHFFRILVSWSIITACTAAVTNLGGFLTCRAFLGIAEAGLLPGMFWQLTFWYRPDEIAFRIAILSVLGQFSGVLDSLLTYGLSYVDGHGGVAGWRWAYIVCGLIGIAESMWLFLCFPDMPDSPPSRRQFLTPDEGAFLVARLPPNSAKSSDANLDWSAVRRELKSPLLWAYSSFYLCMNSSLVGLQFWLPTIVKSMGLAQGATAQLLNIPTAIANIISALSLSFFLDRDYRVPRPLIVYTGALGLIGLYAGLMVTTSSGALYALIVLTQVFAAIMTTPVVPLRTQSLRGSTSAAFALAFQNSVGQIPGLYSAQFFQAKYAPRYVTSFGICIAFLGGIVGAISVIWKLQYRIEKETRRVRALRLAEAKDGRVAQDDVRF